MQFLYSRVVGKGMFILKTLLESFHKLLFIFILAWFETRALNKKVFFFIYLHTIEHQMYRRKFILFDIMKIILCSHSLACQMTQC